MTAGCRQTGSRAGNMRGRGTRRTFAEGGAKREFPRGSIETSASLPPNRMVCVGCYRCGRERFIIADVSHRQYDAWIAIDQESARRNHARQLFRQALLEVARSSVQRLRKGAAAERGPRGPALPAGRLRGSQHAGSRADPRQHRVWRRDLPQSAGGPIVGVEVYAEVEPVSEFPMDLVQRALGASCHADPLILSQGPRHPWRYRDGGWGSADFTIRPEPGRRRLFLPRACSATVGRRMPGAVRAQRTGTQ